MPFIHIKSLPFDKPQDTRTLVEEISREFAALTGIGLEHVTTTWEFLPEGCYAVGGRAASFQPRDTHPVLVDLLSPDFNSPELVEKMFHALGRSISSRVEVSERNIFINHRKAYSGRVFDSGKIIRW